ncbi:uncharacterized protein LOC114648659 [Erpetoichthys calabaricus]|uniref:uncharacterized protein LOC114648659 n=1 Tax=Erpetoichthys calabaricus TaxID=27687 RepID=UPI00223444FB|nr:uncharacterized protein LOC114648659 [Erpetoichthys calabaricus]
MDEESEKILDMWSNTILTNCTGDGEPTKCSMGSENLSGSYSPLKRKVMSSGICPKRLRLSEEDETSTSFECNIASSTFDTLINFSDSDNAIDTTHTFTLRNQHCTPSWAYTVTGTEMDNALSTEYYFTGNQLLNLHDKSYGPTGKTNSESEEDINEQKSTSCSTSIEQLVLYKENQSSSWSKIIKENKDTATVKTFHISACFDNHKIEDCNQSEHRDIRKQSDSLLSTQMVSSPSDPQNFQNIPDTVCCSVLDATLEGQVQTFKAHSSNNVVELQKYKEDRDEKCNLTKLETESDGQVMVENQFENNVCKKEKSDFSELYIEKAFTTHLESENQKDVHYNGHPFEQKVKKETVSDDTLNMMVEPMKQISEMKSELFKQETEYTTLTSKIVTKDQPSSSAYHNDKWEDKECKTEKTDLSEYGSSNALFIPLNTENHKVELESQDKLEIKSECDDVAVALGISNAIPTASFPVLSLPACKENNLDVKLSYNNTAACSVEMKCANLKCQGQTMQSNVKKETTSTDLEIKLQPQKQSSENKCELIKQEMEENASASRQSCSLPVSHSEQCKNNECKIEESSQLFNSSKNAPVNSLFCENEKGNLSNQVKEEIKEEDGSVDIGLGIPKKITMSPEDELLEFKQKHLGAVSCPVVVGHTSPQCQTQVLTQKLKQESVADDALNNGLVPPQTVLESLVQELQKLQQRNENKQDQIKQIRANTGLKIHVENEAIAGSFESSQYDQCKNHVIYNLDDSGVMTNNICSTLSNKREHLVRPGDIKVENESGEVTVCLRGPSPATVCPVLQSSVKIEPQNFQGSAAEIEAKVPNTLYFSASLKCSQNQSLQHEGKNESVMNESSNIEGTAAQPGTDSLVLHAKGAQHSGQGKQKCEHISLNTAADEEISSAYNDHNVQCNCNLYNKETLNDSKIQTNVICTPLLFDNEKEQQYSLGSVKIKQESECVAVNSEIPNPGPTMPMSDLYLQVEQLKWQPIVDMNKKNILHPQHHQWDISLANIKRKKCVTNDATLSSDLLTSSYEQQSNVHLSQEDGKIIKKGSSTLSAPLRAKEESTNKSVLEIRSDKQTLNVGSGGSFQHPVDPSFNKAILHIQRRERPFFQNCEFCCNFNFKSLAFLKSFSQLYLAVHQTFQEVLDHAKPDLKEDDYVQLDLCTESHKDSMITQGHTADVNVSTFLNKVADKLPATKDILACENLSLTLQTVSNLRGGSGIGSQLNYVLPRNILRKKRRCMFILNNQGNNLCFAATLIGLMDLQNARIDKIMKEAVELHKQLNLPPQHMVSFSDIAKFEELLDIKIRVYYNGPDLQEFETSPAPHPRTYFMYLQNNHYYGITSLKSFLGAKQMCRSCHRPTTNTHKCNSICKVCLSSTCQQVKNERVSCKDCYRTCRSRLCYIRHKLLQSDEKNQEPTPSPCDSVVYCRECRNPINLTPGVKAHQCQMVTCHGCGERSRDEKHRCFLSELKPEPLTSNYIFFDIICRPGRIPCYIYALSIDSTVEKAFYGNDCIARFCTFFIKSRFEGYTFLAHNCKNFDGDLILNFLVQNHIKCEYFNLGTSFKGFTVLLTKIRFINTYCFMPMKLRAMPKAFGFKMFRGYFPHYFNTPIKENYCGLVPPIQYYGQRHLVGEESSCFLPWYKLRRSTGFNLLSEMKKYCKNSVDMLLQALLCFRNVFSDGKDIDPFKFENIGNAAMALFRTIFFPKNTIPVIPFDIYRREYRYFQAANIQWLEYVSAVEGIKIQHALNAGEKQFGPYFVDGFATIDGEDICFLYCACSIYGCPECLKNISRRSCARYSKKYEDLQEKISYLKGRNLQIRIMWEHEWLELKQDPKMRPFLKKYPDPFDPWESIYGNRAEAICLLYKIQPDEKIKYFVFNDLLMSVYKTKSFPAGHPVIIRENFDDLSEYFGFAKVTIFPPKKLLFPVLGTCLNGHILFSLCRTCAEMKQTAICTHEDEQRSLTGIWSTVELSKALECGYRVGKVFEVWHFEKRSTKLFERYIKRNMKIKQEAQGFPNWCNNDEQKDLYVKKYFDEEGVKLETDNIKMNQGSYKVSSLLLDSLWEEFGSSAVNFRSSIVTMSQELDKHIFSKYLRVLNVNFFNETTAYVQWHYDSDTKKFPTNIFLASFASAYVHLELYSVLENLQDRCLYFDTDTIVFVSRPGSWEPPLSTKLGSFSSRIKNEDHIIEFVSANHKTYGYKTFKGEAYMKVKGFAFEHASSDQVNLASIIDLVKTDVFKLGPDNKNTNQNMVKGVQPDFNIVFDKRVLNSDHFTLPYGY